MFNSFRTLWWHIPWLLLGCLMVNTAQAELTIEITGGTEGAMPISVVPFGVSGPSEVPEDIAAIITADLRGSGRFAPLPAEDMLTQPNKPDQVKFRNWQALGQENLVIGQVSSVSPNAYTVRFQLFDTFRQTQLIGYSFPATRKDLRRTAHHISDLIYEKLTGQKGAFSSRILYITTRGIETGKPEYRLQIADIDGFNAHNITTSSEPIMSPAWSPDGKRIAYVSFEKKRSAIYIQTLANGQRQQVTNETGINGAPAWSPDGSQLALTLSKDGNPNIYVLNLISRALRRVTHSPAIDTEPVWTRDGQNIVFTSDRGGKPQLYSIPAQGGKPRRLTFEGDYNARASISPDGKQLAMVHANKGDYRIAVMDMHSGNLRVLTRGRLDESPSFAPNGSMILYATRQGPHGQLAAVSSDGQVHQQLRLDSGEVREPAWSPM